MFPFILILLAIGIAAKVIEDRQGGCGSQIPQLPPGSSPSSPDIDTRQLTMENSGESRWEPLRQKVIAAWRKSGLGYGVYSVMPNGIILQNTATSDETQAKIVYDAAPTQMNGQNLTVLLIQDGQILGMKQVK